VFLPFFVHRVLWFHKAGGLEGLGTRAEPAAREPEAATRLSGRFFADPACGRYPKASRQWVPLKIRNACKAWTLSRDSLGLSPAGGVSVMAARANWKGYLRLSLVSCPVALFPATTESEKIRFHQLHKQTGNRIRYRKVDDETGREVDSEDIVKAYEVSKGNYIELTDEDLELSSLPEPSTSTSSRPAEIDDLYT
jgi:hypothetical protein